MIKTTVCKHKTITTRHREKQKKTQINDQTKFLIISLIEPGTNVSRTDPNVAKAHKLMLAMDNDTLPTITKKTGIPAPEFHG